MKHGFQSALRTILFVASALLTAGRADAQISPPPPCNGPLTIYFSVAYRDCDSPRANAKVTPNCGTLPFSYQWSNGTISNEIIDVLPGVYTATVTDAKGLKAIGSVTILGPSSTPFNVAATAIGLGCTGSTGTGSAKVTTTGGTAPYDLKWRKIGGSAFQNVQNVGSSYTITGLTVGNWIIIANDERNCRDTAFVDIKQGLVVANSQSGATCSGASVTVDATGGTSPYKIQWAGGTVNNATLPNTFPNVTSGTYTFTVTDATGCTGTTTAEVVGVPLFTIGATSTPVTCANSQGGTITVSLTTPGTAPYKIQLNGGAEQDATFPFTFSNLAAGDYNIRVTDASKCVSNTTVEVETALDVVLTVKAPATPLCGGSDVVVTLGNSGTSPYTITWTGADGFAGTAIASNFPYTIANVPPGPITVNVKDATGCTGSETGTSVGNPVMQIKIVNVVHPTCANPQGGAFTVEFVTPGVDPHTITWSGGGNPMTFIGSTTFNNLSGGTYTVTVTDINNCTDVASVKIETPLNVVLTPQPAANPLCGGADVVVSITGTLGTSPYTIRWSGGMGLQNGEVQNQTLPYTIPNAAPGTFCVTVTDKNNCTGTECIEIVGPPVLLIRAINVMHPTCANPKGGSFTIEIVSPVPPPPYSVEYAGPSTPTINGLTYSNLGSGIYTITVKTANGCADTVQIKIESPLNVTLTPQPAANPLCGGVDVVVDIAGNKGLAPYKIQWSGSNGLQVGEVLGQNLPYTVPNVGPGTFCVTVTDATGCTGTECTQIVGPPVMLIRALNIVNPTCANPTGGAFTVAFVVPGTPPYTIKVEGPSGLVFDGAFTSPRTFSNLSGGTYGVTVTDANNCTATVSVKIETPLNVILTPQPAANPLCGGVDVVVSIGGNQGVPPYTIKWSGGTANAQNGEVKNQTLPYTISNVGPGTFCVTVTDATGCTGVECIEVVGPPVMLIRAVNIVKPTCADPMGGAFTIEFVVPGTAPYTIKVEGPNFTFSGPFTSPRTFSGLSAGTYGVTVTDANNCTATTSVKIETPLDVTLTPQPAANPLCGGVDVVVDIAGNKGLAPYKIEWLGSNGLQPGMVTGQNLPFTIPNIGPGTFCVTVTDATGCTGVECIEITGPPVMLIHAVNIVQPTCDKQQGGAFTVEFVVPGTASYTIKVEGPGGLLVFSGPFTSPRTFTGLSAGTYGVTVTDANNCTATTTVKLETPIDVVLNPILPANPACGGQDVVVSITGSQLGMPPYVVSWSGGNGNFTDTLTVATLPFTIPNVPPGNFCVTVTDSKGCTGSECTTVQGNPVMLISTTSTGVTCADSLAGTITVSFVVPGIAPFKIEWSGPSSGGPQTVTLPFTITGLAAGDYCITVTDANGCKAKDCIKVETALDVVLNPIPPANAACGGQDVVINITGTQGTPSYIITWSGAGNFAGTATVLTLPFTVANVPPGAFNVTVTDKNGCTGTERTTITGDPVMLITATAKAVTCDNAQAGSITVSFLVPGKAPYKIQWAGPSNGGPVAATFPYTISNLAAGDYCITVTDDDGCTATTCATVETALDVVLTPLPPLNAACGGADVVVTIAGTQQGMPDYIVQWSGGNGSFTGKDTVSGFPFTIPNVPPGNFCVTVTDSKGCTGSECTTITGNPVMLIKAVATAVTCEDSLAGTITVSFVVPGKAPYTLAWSGPVSGSLPGVTLPHTITGLPEGDYTLTVTDANGCTATTTARVETAIDVTLTPTAASNSACGGGNLIIDVKSGGVPPFKYTWAGPFSLGGTVDPATFPDTLKNLPLGTYTVTVTDANGCTGTETATIIGSPKMVIKIDTVIGITCTGGGADGMIIVSMPVPGMAPFTIQWTGSAPVQNAVFPFKINGLAPGTYTITVTDSKGCTATATAKVEMALDVTLKPIAGSNFNCTGGSLVVDVANGAGMPPFDIKWSGPSSGEKLDVTLPDTLKNLLPGLYTVTVTDSKGCTGTETATVGGDTLFQIAALGTNLLCDGDGKDGQVTVTLVHPSKAPYSVSWTGGGPGGGPVQNVTFPFLISGLGSGVITVTATDAYGCTSTAQVTLTGGPADVAIEALSPVDTCENLPIKLNAKNLDPNDVLTYVWTASSPNVKIDPANAANPTVTTTKPGTYTVTLVATNQFGCSDTLTQTVTFDTLQSLKGLITANLCNGLLVQFDNLSGMAGVWNFGDNITSTEEDPLHAYKTAGNYKVTFDPNQDCVIPFDTTIVVQATPAVEADFGFEVGDCFGKAEIKFTDSTKFVLPGKTWAWTFDPPAQSSSLQNPTITFTTLDTVKVQLIATDVNGCMDTTSMAVPVQFVTDSIQEVFKFCIGDSIQLNPTGAQTTFAYAWTSTPLDPTLNPTDPTPTVKPTQTTTYNLVITTPNKKCEVKYTAMAMLKDGVTADTLADLTVCDDDPLTLTLGNTDGTKFVWSDSPTFSPVLGTGKTLTIVPEKNKTYYYKAENATDCPLTGEVKVNLAALDIQPSPLDQKVCLGAEAVLNIGNLDLDDTLKFVWTPALDPVANPSVVPTKDGTYSVVVTNQFGCSDTIDFKVMVIDLGVTAKITGEDTLYVGQTTTLLATVTGNVQNPVISWTPSETLTGANTLNPTAKPTVTTEYIVEAMSPDEMCFDTAMLRVVIITGQCEEPFIFVPNTFTPNNDNSNDMFVVRGGNITEILFIVWNRWGEEVYRTTDPNASGWDGTANGKDSTPDSYAWYLKARCGNGAEFVKKGNVTLLK